jgi:hypothetical protein
MTQRRNLSLVVALELDSIGKCVPDGASSASCVEDSVPGFCTLRTTMTRWWRLEANVTAAAAAADDDVDVAAAFVYVHQSR